MKVIAFDTFGTVFNTNHIPNQDISYYANIISQPTWQPLNLPPSFHNLQAHPDAPEGIAKLRQNYQVVTCSNCPIKLLTKLSKDNHITWDAIIPIECYKVYKPNRKAYLAIAELMGVNPQDIMMVTANPTFGDIEAAQELNMIPQIIRHHPHPNTIIDLANMLV